MISEPTADRASPPDRDPAVPDWTALELPPTRADAYDLRKPRHLYRALREVFSKTRKPVELPSGVPGSDWIPRYVLQEFHNLPNGNYSKILSRGYVTGFEYAMLGTMKEARERMATKLRDCESVLDAGCAGGKMAAAVHEAGVPDVWGIDPSPYLLQHAAHDHPEIKFVQGLAEAPLFPTERFDGITASFLFHELPPRFAELALANFHRMLKPEGLVAICEPSPIQLELSPWRTLRQHGFSGLYYSMLARRAFEPFVLSWHKVATHALFEAHGFECIEDEVGMPLRELLLRKRVS